MAKAKAEKSVADEKKAVLNAALAAINKACGEGSISRLGDAPIVHASPISTGSLGLDIALGIGGMPQGRIIEIYGPEASGKTTLTLQVIAQAQKMGLTCAFIDAEHALDPVYARALGVKTDDLLISQPSCGEEALEICEKLAATGVVEVIVVDSVAALTPKAEIEGEMGDTHVGLQARLMSQALRKLTAIVAKMNSMVIFINQIRMKIGAMGYGSPETTTGGNALKFYASVRIDIRKIATLKQGDEPIGNRTRAKVVKNKVAPPFKTAEFDVMYGEGSSYEGELIDYGCKYDIVEKAGAWFSYNGDKLGQGREKAKDTLRANPALASEIAEKIKAAMLPKPDEENAAEVSEVSEQDSE